MLSRVFSGFIVILIIFLTISFIYLYLPRESEKLIYIPSLDEKGFEYALKFQKIPLTKFELELLNKIKRVNSKWVRVKKRTTKVELFKIILTSKGEKERNMVMYGGSTIDEFLSKISKQADLNITKLNGIYKELSPFKEGGVLASRYKIPYNTTERATLSYMIYKSFIYFKKLEREYQMPINSKEFKDRVIVASIIEKETQDYNEMPLISSVIYNRLRDNLKLQMDATLNYGKNSHKVVTPEMIRSDNSKFNTYKYKGLPPEILGSFSKVALKASFEPAESNYRYFVLKREGKSHIFSSSYQQHKKFIRIYKKISSRTSIKESRALELENREIVKEILENPLQLDFPTLLPDISIYNLKLK